MFPNWNWILWTTAPHMCRLHRHHHGRRLHSRRHQRGKNSSRQIRTTGLKARVTRVTTRHPHVLAVQRKLRLLRANAPPAVQHLLRLSYRAVQRKLRLLHWAVPNNSAKPQRHQRHHAQRINLRVDSRNLRNTSNISLPGQKSKPKPGRARAGCAATSTTTRELHWSAPRKAAPPAGQPFSTKVRSRGRKKI